MISLLCYKEISSKAFLLFTIHCCFLKTDWLLPKVGTQSDWYENNRAGHTLKMKIDERGFLQHMQTNEWHGKSWNLRNFFWCSENILVWFFWSESKHWPLTKYHCFMSVVEWCSLGETMNMASLQQLYFNSSVYFAICPNEYKLVGTETHFTCRKQIWVPYIPKCIKDEGYDSGIDQTG